MKFANRYSRINEEMKDFSTPIKRHTNPGQDLEDRIGKSIHTNNKNPGQPDLGNLKIKDG